MSDHGYEALARSELPIDTVELARYLIGKVVARVTPEGLLAGRIVETEAYPVGDAASHAYRGGDGAQSLLHSSLAAATPMCASLTASHYMLNVSKRSGRGVGAGVLIRARAPLEGVAEMRKNRGVETLRDLTRGPGRLAAAFDIDRRLDGLDLCRPRALVDRP